MSHHRQYSSIYHTLSKNDEEIKKEISLQHDLTNERFLDANSIENEIKSAPLIDIFKAPTREQRSPTVNVNSYAGSYEQVSKHDMLSRYRERRTMKQGLNGQSINSSPSKDVEEIQEETVYEYVIEAPKSGLIFRDEVLPPIFLPTKYEQNLFDQGTATLKDNESKAPSELLKEEDEMKTEDGAETQNADVREFIYCRYPSLLQAYQENSQGTGASSTESAPASSATHSSTSKAFWGLTFDSNFECGNLFSVESIIRKKAALGSPEEYDLFLSCDPHYIVDEDDVKTMLAGNASIDSLSQHVYHQHYLTEQLKFQSNSLSNTWFFFKITNTKKRSYRFNIHYLSKSNRLIYGRNRFKPLMLSDYQYHNHRKGWQRVGEDITFKKCKQKRLQSFHAPTIVNEATIFGDSPADVSQGQQERKKTKNKKKKKKIPNYYTLSFTFHCENAKDTIYFASHPLYTYTQLQHTIHSLVNKSSLQNHVQARKIARTLAGNSCDLVVITENNSLMKEEFYYDKMHENKNEILDGKTPSSHRNTFSSTNNESSSTTSNQHHSLHISSQYSYTLKEILNPKSQISLLKPDQVEKHVNEVLRHKMNSFSLTSNDYDTNTNTSTSSMDEFLSNKNEKNHFQEIMVDGKPIPKYLQKLQLVIETNIEMEKRKKFEKFRKPAIIFLTRFHSDESNSNWIMEGIMKFLLSNNELAYKMRKTCVFYFFPMINVDAVVNGFNKFSLSGQNIQQCWANPSPLVNPSIVRIKQVLSKIMTSTTVLGFFHLKSSNYNPYEGILFHSKVMKDIETKESNASISSMKRNTRLLSSIGASASVDHHRNNHHSIESVDEDEELEEFEDQNNKTTTTTATAIGNTTELNEINPQNLPPVGQLFTSVANRSTLLSLKSCSVKDPVDKNYSIRSLITDDFKIPYSVAIHAHNYRGLYGKQYLRPYDYAKFGGELCLGLSDLLNETLNLDSNANNSGLGQSFLHSASKGMSYDPFDAQKKRQKSLSPSFSSPLRGSMIGAGGSNQPSFLAMGKSFNQNNNTHASIRQSKFGGGNNYAEILQTLPSIDDDKPFQAAVTPHHHYHNRNAAAVLSTTQSTFAIGDMDLEDESMMTEEQLKERKEKLYRQNFSEDDKITLETTPPITNIQFNEKVWAEQENYSSSDDEIREKEIVREQETIAASTTPVPRQSMSMLRSSMIVPGTLLLSNNNNNAHLNGTFYHPPQRGNGSSMMMVNRISTTGRNTATAKALSEIQQKFGRRLSFVRKEDLDDSDLDDENKNDNEEDEGEDNLDEEIDENEAKFNELFEDKDKYSLFTELNKKYELLWQKTLSKFLRRSDVIGLPKSSLAMTPSQALHDTERIYRFAEPLTMSTFGEISVINIDKVFPPLSLQDIFEKKKLLKEKLKKIQQNNLQNMIITMKFDESMFLKDLSENPEELAKEIQAKLDALQKPKKLHTQEEGEEEESNVGHDEQEVSIASSHITAESGGEKQLHSKSSSSSRNQSKSSSPRTTVRRTSPTHHSPSPTTQHRVSPTHLRKSQTLKSSSIEEESEEQKEMIDSSTETFKITSFKSKHPSPLQIQHSPHHSFEADPTTSLLDHDGLALTAVPFSSLRKSNQFQSPMTMKPTVTFGSFAKSRSKDDQTPTAAGATMSDFFTSRGLTLEKLRLSSSLDPHHHPEEEALEPTDHLFHDVTRSTPGRVPETAFTDFLGSEFDPNEELKDIPIIQDDHELHEDGEEDQGQEPTNLRDPTLYDMIQRNMDTVQTLMKDPSFMILNEEEKLKILSTKVPSYDANQAYRTQEQAEQQHISALTQGPLTQDEIYQAFVREMGFNYQQIFGREGILTREMQKRRQGEHQHQSVTAQGAFSQSLPYQKPFIKNHQTIVGKSTNPQYHMDYSSNFYLRYQLYHYYQYILQQLLQRKVVDADKVDYYAQAIFQSIQHKYNVFSPNKLTRNPSPIMKKRKIHSQSLPFRSMTAGSSTFTSSMMMDGLQETSSQAIWEKSTITFNNQLRAPSTNATIFEEKASIVLQNTQSIKSSINERLAKVHQIQRMKTIKNQQYPSEIPTWLPDSYKQRILTTYDQQHDSQRFEPQASWISGLHEQFGIPAAAGGSHFSHYSPNQSHASAPPTYYFNLSTYSVPSAQEPVATGSSLEHIEEPSTTTNEVEEEHQENPEEQKGEEIEEGSKGTTTNSRGGISRITAESLMSGRFNDEDEDTLPPPEAHDSISSQKDEPIEENPEDDSPVANDFPVNEQPEEEDNQSPPLPQQQQEGEGTDVVAPITQTNVVDEGARVLLISQPTPLRSPELVNAGQNTSLPIVSPTTTLKKYAAKQITFPSIFPTNANNSSFQSKNPSSSSPKKLGKNHIPKNKEQGFVKIPKFAGKDSPTPGISSSNGGIGSNVNFFELQLQSPSSTGGTALNNHNTSNQNSSPSPTNQEDNVNRINRKSPPLLSILQSYPTQSKDFNFSSLHLDENESSKNGNTSPTTNNKQKSMKSNAMRASSPPTNINNNSNKNKATLPASDSQKQLMAARPPNDPKPSGVMRSPSLKVKQTVRITTPKAEPEAAQSSQLEIPKLHFENDEISCDLSV